jgi:hypothetical protein
MLRKLLLMTLFAVGGAVHAQPVTETVPMLGLSMAFDQEHVQHQQVVHWQAGLMQRSTTSGDWRSLAGFSYRSTTGLRSTLMGVEMSTWNALASKGNGIAEGTLGAIILGAGAVGIAIAAEGFGEKKSSEEEPEKKPEKEPCYTHDDFTANMERDVCMF